MNPIIVYSSFHHNNTEKIANIIAEELDSELVKAVDAQLLDFSSYNIIGFGSGIYMGGFDKHILSLIEKSKGLDGKKVFIFSTSGAKKSFFNNFEKKIREKIEEKGGVIVNSFNCLGFDTYGPMSLVGGFNKGRPNENDLADAIIFARELKGLFLEIDSK